MHDQDYNVGHAIEDAGAGIGRALAQVMSMSEGRRNRAYELARQGRLDAQSARRLEMDEERLALEAERTEQSKRLAAQRRTDEIADRFRSDMDAGWSAPRDLDVTHPAMFRVEPPVAMPGMMDASGHARPTSMAGALTQVGAPRRQQATFDPTRSVEYREREARLAQDQRFEGTEPPAFTMGGRSFADTPEGREAGLDWRRQVAEAGRTPEDGTNMFAGFGGDLNSRGGEESGNWLGKAMSWARGLAGRGDAATDEPESVTYDEARSYVRQREAERRTDELLAQGMQLEQIQAVLIQEGYTLAP